MNSITMDQALQLVSAGTESYRVGMAMAKRSVTLLNVRTGACWSLEQTSQDETGLFSRVSELGRELGVSTDREAALKIEKRVRALDS